MNRNRTLPRVWLALALTAAALIASPLLAGANLLTNPGFEDGAGSYTGWFTFGAGAPPTNVQISRPTGDNIIRTGLAASKIFGGFNGCPLAPVFNVSGYGQAFTPTAGQVYQLSGFSYVSSADSIPGTETCFKNRMLAKISFFNAVSGGSEIAANEIVIGDGNTPLDRWLPFSVSAPVPAGALRVEALFLYLQPACDGGAVYVDDVDFVATTPVVETNLLANPSFATGLTGWTTFANAFADTRAFIVRSPPGCAKLFGPFTIPGDASGMYQTFTAIPGENWQLEVYSLTTCRDTPTITGTNDNIATAKIVFRDALDVELGSREVRILDNASPLGTWTKHSVTAISPTGTAKAQAYIVFVQPTTMGGAMWVDDVSFRNLGLTGVEQTIKPGAFELRQNTPNPFAPSTRIDFTLASRGAVDLGVFDVAGRRVATLMQGEREAGAHHVTWSGKTSNGNSAAAGVYWFVLKTPAGRWSRSMVLMK